MNVPSELNFSSCPLDAVNDTNMFPTASATAVPVFRTFVHPFEPPPIVLADVKLLQFETKRHTSSVRFLKITLPFEPTWNLSNILLSSSLRTGIKRMNHLATRQRQACCSIYYQVSHQLYQLTYHM